MLPPRPETKGETRFKKQHHPHPCQIIAVSLLAILFSTPAHADFKKVLMPIQKYLQTFSIIGLAFISASNPCLAASGIDTQTGTSSLPFNIEGTNEMTLSTGGLSINNNLVTGGTIQPGSNGIQTNASCPVEGQIAYDAVNHAPVYCNVSRVWQAMGGGSITLQETVVGAQACGSLAHSTATCPAGYTVSGCGYGLSKWSSGQNSPDGIFPAGNGCAVQTGGNESGNCEVVYAFCLSAIQ